MPIRKFEWNPFTLEGEAPASLRFWFAQFQSNWKFFQDDAAEPTEQLEEENVTPTLENNNIIRCRVAVNTFGMEGATGIVSMQYSTDDVNFSDVGSYPYDWVYANGKGDEFSQVSTFKLSNSTLYGNYYESGTLSKYFDIGYQEIDFAIQPLKALYNTTYYFRLLLDGGEISPESGLSHPQVTTKPAPVGWTYKGEVLSYGGVSDIVSFGGEIYSGTSSDDASLAGVYRYDGGVWTIVGTFREYEAAYRFVEFGGDLYVGTSSSTIPGTYYARVYKYMGETTWTQVGGDIGTNEEVCSMCVFDGTIHIGTWNSGKVYRLDGESWTDLGQVDSETLIYSLIDFGGELFAGGYNGKVYKLVTGSWVAQSGNLVGSRLVVHNGELYGCHYQESLLVYKYNGPSDWTEIGNFADGGDGELVSDGTDLYIGGCFGDDPWPIKFYKYLGTPGSWEQLAGIFEIYDSLYCFKAWDGLLWSGMDGTVWSYESTPEPIFINRGTPLYSGYPVFEVHSFAFLSPNIFTAVDIPEYMEMYRFDDPDWTLMIHQPPKRPNVLLVYGGELYTGIYSSTDSDARVYKYDSGTDLWSQVGGTLSTNKSVYSMIEFDYTGTGEGQIYVGTYPSGIVYRLDDGPVWTSVGRLGAEVSIISLAAIDNHFVVLYGAGHQGKVYRFDGESTWTAISPDNYYGQYLIIFNDELYGVAGAYGIPTVVRKYSGSETDWTQIGGDLEEPFNIPAKIAVYNDKLYVSVHNSETHSKIYRFDDPDWIYVQSFDSSVYSLEVENDILWAGLEDGSIWSYTEAPPPPSAPTTDELMRHLKWFHGGENKGCWLG